MNRVVHFEIQADDVERASEFYRKALGWKIEQVMEKAKNGMDYWGVTTGEAEPGINGGLYKRSESDQKYFLYDCTVEVDDVEAASKAVVENGGKIVRAKMEIAGVGIFASAEDTEGNRFGLIQMKS